MDNMQNDEMSPFALKVQRGLAVANRRLMEFDTALERNLIIGQPDGTYKEIPAKNMLAESRHLPWWKHHFEQ